MVRLKLLQRRLGGMTLYRLKIAHGKVGAHKLL